MSDNVDPKIQVTQEDSDVKRVSPHESLNDASNQADSIDHDIMLRHSAAGHHHPPLTNVPSNADSGYGSTCDRNSLLKRGSKMSHFSLENEHAILEETSNESKNQEYGISVEHSPPSDTCKPPDEEDSLSSYSASTPDFPFSTEQTSRPTANNEEFFNNTGRQRVNCLQPKSSKQARDNVRSKIHMQNINLTDKSPAEQLGQQIVSQDVVLSQCCERTGESSKTTSLRRLPVSSLCSNHIETHVQIPIAKVFKDEVEDNYSPHTSECFPGVKDSIQYQLSFISLNSSKTACSLCINVARDYVTGLKSSSAADEFDVNIPPMDVTVTLSVDDTTVKPVLRKKAINQTLSECVRFTNSDFEAQKTITVTAFPDIVKLDELRKFQHNSKAILDIKVELDCFA